MMVGVQGQLSYGPTWPGEEANGKEPAPAFKDLVELYYAALYQFAFSLTRCEADACDLTQQTFYTFSIKGQQLRDGSKAKSWLFTTLHRAFLQRRRRENRFPLYELDKVEAELPHVAPQDYTAADSEQVLNALERLDEAFRAPLALFYLEDYAYKDIARILDIPLGTVKSRIARGISHLQRTLGAARECSQRVAA